MDQPQPMLADAFKMSVEGETVVIEFGRGRVFHTILGHEDYSFEGVGFITTLLRGTEWAATGAVTLPVPPDFPTETQATRRPFAGPAAR